MKLVRAYIRTFEVHNVIERLHQVEQVPRVTAIDVLELGDEIDPDNLEVISEYGTTYTKMAKLELIIPEDSVKKVIDIILETSHTGYQGDGIVSVSPVDRVINITTKKDENASKR